MKKFMLAGAALLMTSGIALAQADSQSSTTTTTQTPGIITVAPPVDTMTTVQHTTSDQNGVLTEETKRSQVTVPSIAPTVTSTTRTEKITTTGSDD